MERIVECVPNFSEGRDMEVIGRIAEAISEVSGIRILDIDPGAAANRTVITFIGSPEAVAEAAFRGVEKAAELALTRAWALPTYFHSSPYRE